jgi:hypothetical protein
VVSSCSFLHEVSRVTGGRRFAFLPFLYDDAAARVREANIHRIGAAASQAAAPASPGGADAAIPP